MTKDKDCAPLLREAEKAAKAWRVRCSTDPGDMSMCKPKDDCVFGYTQGYFAALQLFVNVLDIKIKPSFDAADKTKSTRADIEGLAYDVHHHWSVGHKDEAVAAILRFCPLVDTAGVREACAKECEKRGHVTSADAIRAIPTPEAPASVEPVAAQNDWDKGAQALIKEAAALVQPSEGEAVFYIRVGGEHTSMNVKTKGQVDPDTALKNAIGALNGERSALSNCPVHNNPNGSHHQRGGDLREAREVIAYSIIEGSAGIRAAEHAKDFQTVNWSDALRSADAVIATLAALPPVEQSVGEG